MTSKDSEAEQSAFLAFSLGPVQPFIASARSLRDLWTGSYLLSWLTFQAMRPVLETAGTEVVFPSLEGNPLFRHFPIGRPAGASTAEGAGATSSVDAPETYVEALLTPCLPNRFVAVVPCHDDGTAAEQLAERCREALRRVWVEEICQAVYEALASKAKAFSTDWDEDRWRRQVGSYFEVRTAVLPWARCDASALRRWVRAEDSASLWSRRRQLLAGLMQTHRMVRHVPTYRLSGEVPQKCTMLGSYEQMGPSDLQGSRAFWTKFSGIKLKGTRTRPGERLCALSLVKRFAWPAYLGDRLHVRIDDRRFSDTATVAAAAWLSAGDEAHRIDPREEQCLHKRWSGRWLHWHRRDEEVDQGEPPVPQELFDRIRATRDLQGSPPVYYAILTMDGDRMGQRLRHITKEQEGKISGRLAHFATQTAGQVVQDHQGELIYAGGDDVLALLPTEHAVACTLELSKEFSKNWPAESGVEPATVSAGIAVVHYQEDLRSALEAARRAEEGAKAGLRLPPAPLDGTAGSVEQDVRTKGRNALMLTVCRRSGEHASVLLPWKICDQFQKLVELFKNGASDRWAYKLRRELPTLAALPFDACRAEVRRLAKRTDSREGIGSIKTWADDTLPAYRDEFLSRCEPDTDSACVDATVIRQFTLMGQAASFLARGKDE